ncbi:MAG: Sec-independent protein translocase protein TatB [Desulfovibrionaceae bacterium]
MFGIGTTELLMILVVALLVLGPKKLPEIARTLGKGLAEFRRVSSDFNRTIQADVEREEMTERKKKAEKELFGDKTDAKTAAKADAKTDAKTDAKADAPGKDAPVVDVTPDAVSAAPTAAPTAAPATPPAAEEEKKA